MWGKQVVAWEVDSRRSHAHRHASSSRSHGNWAFIWSRVSSCLHQRRLCCASHRCVTEERGVCVCVCVEARTTEHIIRPQAPGEVKFLSQQLTSCDDALQPDDVRMVKLSHDGGLGQEVPPLLVRVTRLQTLDGHVDLPLSLSAQSTTAHLPKLPYKNTDRRHESLWTDYYLILNRFIVT